MPRSAVHTGKVLAEELDASSVTPTQLAHQVKVPPNRITQIINGKRAVTGDTALRPPHWFKTSPDFWLNIQAEHNLQLAKQTTGTKISQLPTKETSTSLRGSRRRDSHRAATPLKAMGKGWLTVQRRYWYDDNCSDPLLAGAIAHGWSLKAVILVGSNEAASFTVSCASD